MGPTQKRILCVEDDDDTCQFLAYLLELSGYEVKTAKTVTEGLGLSQQDHFDLLLLDNLLPDGNGLDLCRQIRSFKPDVAILFLSGSVFEDEYQEALTAGAQAYLKKPVDPDVLTQTVSQLLKR